MKVKYKYDKTNEVLIELPKDKSPMIIKKRDMVWKPLTGEDDSYLRAIFLGQGAWDKLDDISNEEAQDVLKKWGFFK